MRHIIIGDVHGCLDELKRLVTLAAPRVGETKLYFLGDLVDRGPKSAETVRYVRELLATYGGVCVRGNHDDKYVRYRKHLAAGRPDAMRVNQEIYMSLTSDDIDFLEECPLYHEIPELGILLVHAGLPIDKDYKDTRDVMYMRYVRPENDYRMVTLYRQRPTDVLWADVYTGEHGTVVYGHHSRLEVQYSDHAIGIDTACVYGGNLTALVYENDDFRVIQVKGTEYAEL